MFSQVSEILLGSWGHMDLWQGTPLPPTSDLGSTSLLALLLTSGSDHWKHVQTCSLEDLPSPHDTDIQWWPPKHIWLVGGRQASYWNAVLLCLHFVTFGILVFFFTRNKYNSPPVHFNETTSSNVILGLCVHFFATNQSLFVLFAGKGSKFRKISRGFKCKYFSLVLKKRQYRSQTNKISLEGL